jgi:hypothetical protein
MTSVSWILMTPFMSQESPFVMILFFHYFEDRTAGPTPLRGKTVRRRRENTCFNPEGRDP